MFSNPKYWSSEFPPMYCVKNTTFFIWRLAADRSTQQNVHQDMYPHKKAQNENINYSLTLYFKLQMV